MLQNIQAEESESLAASSMSFFQKLWQSHESNNLKKKLSCLFLSVEIQGLINTWGQSAVARIQKQQKIYYWSILMILQLDQPTKFGYLDQFVSASVL